MIWFLLAQGAKRAHDMGQSAWIQLIPIYNISLFFIKGDAKTNKYGDVPISGLNDNESNNSQNEDSEEQPEISDPDLPEETSAEEIDLEKQEIKRKNEKHLNIFLAFLAIILIIGAVLNYRHKFQKPVEATVIPPNCESTIIWGDIDFCLPKFDSFNNVVDSPNIIKNRISMMDGMGNTTKAFLIDESTFRQFKNIDEISFDDYFLLLTVDNLTSKRVRLSDLNVLADAFASQFEKLDLSKLNKKFEEKNTGLKMSKPSLIEKYRVNEKSISLVCLTPIDQNGSKYNQISIANLILVKNRMVSLYYYKNYYSQVSIDSAKTINDKIAIQFSNSNPAEQEDN